jgi:hypothetical protein
LLLLVSVITASRLLHNLDNPDDLYITYRPMPLDVCQNDKLVSGSFVPETEARRRQVLLSPGIIN